MTENRTAGEDTETRPILVQRKASELRQRAERDAHRRRRVLIALAVIVVAGLLSAVLGTMLLSRRDTTKAPSNMPGGAVVLGSDLTAERADPTPAGDVVPPVLVAAQSDDDTSAGDSAEQTSGSASADGEPQLQATLFLDYDCSGCTTFLSTNSEQLRKWIKAGRLSLTVVPMSYTSSQYSIAGANAAACVATFDPDGFFAFTTAMFSADSPANRTRDDIASLAATAVADSGSDLRSCITDGTYDAWVVKVTSTIVNQAKVTDGGEDTPTLPVFRIGTTSYTGDLDDPLAFSSFVLQEESTSSDAEASASPSPTSGG